MVLAQGVAKGCNRRRGRPRELSPAARETAILDAAERLMVEKGLHGASMSAIAKAAGMSKRTLYEVFDNRAVLFEAWVRRARTSFIRPLTAAERDLPLAERLSCMLSPQAAGGDHDTPFAVLRAVVREAGGHPDLGQIFLAEGPQQARRIIAGELARAVAAGEIVLPDVDLAARILCDMACENPMDRLVDPDLPAPGAAAATARITLAIRLFLDGIVQKTD